MSTLSLHTILLPAAFIWVVKAAIYSGDWARYDHTAAVGELQVCWETFPKYLLVVISSLISSTLRLKWNFAELSEEFLVKLWVEYMFLCVSSFC